MLTSDAEIYRIVSSKALDQGEPSQRPDQGTNIVIPTTNPVGDGSKKGQCC